jgi:uncharacterized repeat protein (TIGR03803 family)
MAQYTANRLVLGVAAALLASSMCAQAKYKVIYSFSGGSDGANPAAALLVEHQRATYRTYLYGTASSGGAYGYGTVFKFGTYDGLSVFYAFRGDYGGSSDGASPYSGVIADKEQNLYGTTSGGGGVYGQGTVFKLTPELTETVLYGFQPGDDGHSPNGGVIADKSGNLYGTTLGGGHGEGTVFRLAPDGQETTLYAFNIKRDGAKPNAGLLADGSGNFYGTAISSHGTGHFGTVFKIAADGTETILHAFSGKNGSDGSHPYGALVADETGNLYGTTFKGGTLDCNCGTVFKLAPDGSETMLYAFPGNKSGDGSNPYAGVVADSGGNLYGATYTGGGACNCGTIFRIAADGTETVLYAFAGGTDGAYPRGGLAFDKKGTLYGTTFLGGADNAGTIFELTP